MGTIFFNIQLLFATLVNEDDCKKKNLETTAMIIVFSGKELVVSMSPLISG